MEQIPTTVILKAKRLTQPEPSYVSVVKHAANRSPFQTLKHDAGYASGDPADTGDTPMAGTVAQIAFPKTRFPGMDQVNAFLVTQKWDTTKVNVADNGDHFVAAAKGDSLENYDGIHRLPAPNNGGAIFYVGTLKSDLPAALGPNNQGDTTNDIPVNTGPIPAQTTEQQIATPGTTDPASGAEGQSTTVTTAKTDYSEHDRKVMASNGQAMPDGSFPIANKVDLENAIHDWGRAGSKEDVKAHIMSRAKSLGAESMIPVNWKTTATKSEMRAKFDNWMLYYAQGSSLGDVIREAMDDVDGDQTPPGFDAIMCAIRVVAGRILSDEKAVPGDREAALGRLFDDAKTAVFGLWTLFATLGTEEATKSDGDKPVNLFEKFVSQAKKADIPFGIDNLGDIKTPESTDSVAAVAAVAGNTPTSSDLGNPPSTLTGGVQINVEAITGMAELVSGLKEQLNAIAGSVGTVMKSQSSLGDRLTLLEKTTETVKHDVTALARTSPVSKAAPNALNINGATSPSVGGTSAAVAATQHDTSKSDSIRNSDAYSNLAAYMGLGSR